jgi:Protein of unknown function (DUF2975)
MSELHPNALKVSRRVLSVLIKLNLLMGFLILALLIASIVAEDFVMRALSAAHAEGNSTFIMGMRAIMVIGIFAVPLAHIVLTRLKAIVETVNVGDPFVSENAARLQTIAWTVLALEVMNFAVGSVAERISSTAHPIDIHWKFSVTPWLAVLLLFVLARVFDQGTRMREDLEGTV